MTISERVTFDERVTGCDAQILEMSFPNALLLVI